MLQTNHRPTPAAPGTARRAPGTDAVVVCGLDGSAASVELSRIAGELAGGLGGRVELVHVLGAGPRVERALSVDEERSRAQAMLDGLRDSSGCAASASLVELGDPARRLAAAAESAGADLIVVGSRGNAPVTDALIGSVSSRLAADAPCPVLVIPPSIQRHVRPRTWFRRTMVCGFDGSDAAWGAAVHAAALSARLHSALNLLSVGPAVSWLINDVVAALEARLAETDLYLGPSGPPQIDWELRSGDPAWELERVASAITAPLIAIGSRGMGPRHDPLLGSVARRLLLGARRPILVTPPTALAPRPAAP